VTLNFSFGIKQQSLAHSLIFRYYYKKKKLCIEILNRKLDRIFLAIYNALKICKRKFTKTKYLVYVYLLPFQLLNYFVKFYKYIPNQFLFLFKFISFLLKRNQNKAYFKYISFKMQFSKLSKLNMTQFIMF
jgi:hypothetical protein